MLDVVTLPIGTHVESLGEFLDSSLRLNVQVLVKARGVFVQLKVA